jgi:hypothetical protein
LAKASTPKPSILPHSAKAQGNLETWAAAAGSNRSQEHGRSKIKPIDLSAAKQHARRRFLYAR